MTDDWHCCCCCCCLGPGDQRCWPGGRFRRATDAAQRCWMPLWASGCWLLWRTRASLHEVVGRRRASQEPGGELRARLFAGDYLAVCGVPELLGASGSHAEARGWSAGGRSQLAVGRTWRAERGDGLGWQATERLEARWQYCKGGTEGETGLRWTGWYSSTYEDLPSASETGTLAGRKRASPRPMSSRPATKA